MLVDTRRKNSLEAFLIWEVGNPSCIGAWIQNSFDTRIVGSRKQMAQRGVSFAGWVTLRPTYRLDYAERED
jgi:hypothetical protein